jgi:hypothetical protein
MREIALNAREIWIADPSRSKRLKHKNGIIRNGCIRKRRIGVGRFPHVDEGGGEVDQIIQIRQVDFIHSSEHGQGPLDGGIAVASEARNRECVNV